MRIKSVLVNVKSSHLLKIILGVEAFGSSWNVPGAKSGSLFLFILAQRQSM